MGIEIRVGVEVGSGVTLNQLTDDFDAIFVAAGSWKERLQQGGGRRPPGAFGAAISEPGELRFQGHNGRSFNRGVEMWQLMWREPLIGMGAKTVVLYRRTRRTNACFQG